jgi:uncharacterized protein YcbX
MTQIHFSNDRPAYTVLPDMIDEATGNRIEDTGMLCDTRHAAFAKQDQPDLADPETEYEEHTTYLTEEEALEAGIEFDSEVELDPVVAADISTEIHESTVQYDPEMAAAVVQVPMSDSPADVTVQYLTNQVYEGNLTPQEAFDEALSSGVSHAALADAYQRLKAHFQ